MTSAPVLTAAGLGALLDTAADVVVLEIRRDRATIPAELAAGIAAQPVGHLPGAHVVDFFDFVGPRTATSGDAPLPGAAALQELLRRTGIHDTSTVVVYSPDLVSSATRAWWLLRWAGIADVRYLDGGPRAWLAAGEDLVAAPGRTGKGTARVRPGGLPVLDADGAAALARRGHLLDTRPPRFYAEHIPGAHSLPGTETPPDGHLDDAEKLRARYAPYLTGAPIGAYCGGGVAATIDILALSAIGVTAALYPGSWSQWITDPTRPIATGTARG